MNATLYILDVNNALVLTPGVTEHDFSTYGVELHGDVIGGAVSSYSWDLTSAPDATSVSGTSTSKLTFTWATFTGAARTDLVKLTATVPGGSVSQTIPFNVASTSSPAYSATPPVRASTWPSVLPPDALTEGQATLGCCHGSVLALTTGEVQVHHDVPAYHPSVDPLQVAYSSTAANNKPIFVTHYALDTSAAVPSTVKAQLTLNGTAGQWYYYSTTSSGANKGDTLEIALQGDATGLATGRYSYQVQVVTSATPPVTTTYTGSVDLLDSSGSAFGRGWSLVGYERVWAVTGGVILDLGGGLSLWFANGGTSGTFVSPPGDTSTLSQNTITGVYTRTLPDGTTSTFNSAGRETAWADRNNNTTSYGYNGSNQLVTVTDLNSQVTTFSYTGSTITAITDPANRVTTLAYDGSSRLTSIQDADGALWTYGYDASHRLTTLKNPLSYVTTFVYDSNSGRVASVNRPDGTTESLTAQQLQGWVAPGSGTQASPAAAILAGQAQAQYTDPRGNLWPTYLDWLGFGRTTQASDPIDASDMQVTHVDANGFPWISADERGNRERDFFDSKGNPTTVVQADDTTRQYTYNTFSEVLQATDPLNHLTTYSYDGAGNNTQVKDALGNLTTMTYTGRGFLASQQDPLGHRTTYTYDSLNRLSTTTNALNQVSTISYDAYGRPATVTDPLGHTTSYSYDALNRQTAVMDPLGNRTTTVYDAAGNTIATVDPLGHRTTMTLDALNRVTATKDALGNLATTVYDANGNAQVRIDPLGHRTTFTYDLANRPTQVKDALGNLTTTVYDKAGNVLAIIDALNHRTTTIYDGFNRPVQVSDALGNLSTTVYDAAGNVQSTTNPRGYTTTLTYDALNRQVQVQDALNQLSTTVYDLAGNVQATIDPRGYRTTFVYDNANRQIALTDPLNHTATTVYDAAGNGVQTIDASGFTSTFTYDNLNRQVTSQDPGGGIVTTVYDGAGNTVNTIDALGNKTTYVYDALNRQTQVIDPRGGVTTTVYDALGNTVNLIDPVGNKTTMAYDALNRLTTQTDPLNHSVTFAYDAASRETSTTDRLGRRRDLSYDNDNRLTGETWVAAGGGTTNLLTFTYDNQGNQLTAANNSGTYTMSYDALDRMSTIQEPFGLTLTATYDASGNRTLLQDSFGGVLTSVYDAASHLTSRQFGGTSQTPLRYDLTYTARDQPATATRYSDLAGTTKVGSTTFTYDPAARLTNLQHRDASGTLLANYTYTYDLASRVLTETWNSTTTTYAYDPTNQLTSDGTTAYTYDLNGNRTMTGYQTGTANELTNDGLWTYTYDNEGNLTKKSKGASAETWTYSYDNTNHLTGAQQRATDGGTLLMQATYVYDALGNRLEKDVWTQSSGTTTVTRFAYDGPNAWADLTSTNQLQTRRLYLDGIDELFARIASGTAAWYLTDRLESVRDIANNTTGASIDHLNYDGFGNATESQPGNGDRFRWTSREYDNECGLQCNRARQYSSAVGRWVSQDPSGFSAGDANVYRYVSNMPTEVTDPFGLSAYCKPKFSAYIVVGDLSSPRSWVGGSGRWSQPASAGKGSADIGFDCCGGTLETHSYVSVAGTSWSGGSCNTVIYQAPDSPDGEFLPRHSGSTRVFVHVPENHTYRVDLHFLISLYDCGIYYRENGYTMGMKAAMTCKIYGGKVVTGHVSPMNKEYRAFDCATFTLTGPCNVTIFDYTLTIAGSTGVSPRLYAAGTSDAYFKATDITQPGH